MSMEHDNVHSPISIGAVVEATDGLIGTVIGVERLPDTHAISHLIVENEEQTKQFTIPSSLIARQDGSLVIHLSVARDQLLKEDVEMAVDTNTGNFGFPSPPLPSTKE